MNISDISKQGSQKSYLTMHEDLQKLHVGTLPDHCYFIPFAKDQDAFECR